MPVTRRPALALPCITINIFIIWALFVSSPAPGQGDSFLVFESGHVRPLALSPSGRLLFAVNTPDARLEVFAAQKGSLARRGEARVGLEPVAVAARTEGQVFVVNHLSDSVSVVDVSRPDRPFVAETLLVGDEPRDVVVGGPRRDKVFVTTAHRGQANPREPDFHEAGKGRADVWVFDADDLCAPPHILTLFCDTPRALAVTRDGKRVYAAAFRSGNRTTVLNDHAVDPSHGRLLADGFAAHGMPPPLASDSGVPAPLAGVIVRFDGQRWVDCAGRDWTPRVRLNLPDKDVFVIDAEKDPPAEIGSAAGVGTVIFNLAVHPVDGSVYASSIESKNLARFKSGVQGRIVENRVTIIREGKARAVDLNPHIDSSRPFGPAEEIEKSLALPLGMEFTKDGKRLYLCAFGSDRVAVLDEGGAVLDRIPVGRGPTGLALDEVSGRLYVMSRFDPAVSVVDLASGRLTDQVPLAYDPEPRAIREGRPYLYDARRTSGHGDAACGTCHVFADLDGLAWDLGDPAGAVAPNPLRRPPSFAHIPLIPFHPMRGPMTTPSLRGLKGAGPHHWRGDANGGPEHPIDEGRAFMVARPAFQTLLGKLAEFPVRDMEKLRDFVLALRYPPNPNLRIDGTLTPRQASGKAIFEGDGNPNRLGGSGTPCTECHALPIGTGGLSVPTATQDFKVPHLRNLYQKIGMFGYALPGIRSIFPYQLEERPTPHLGDQVRGYGYTNDGSVPTIHDFFLRPLGFFAFKDEPGRPGREKVRDLEAFLLAFPTGLAPVVGQQVTLHASSPAAAHDRLGVFIQRTAAGDGELVLQGLLGDAARSWLHRADAEEPVQLLSDRAGKRTSIRELRAAIEAGRATITAMVVPPGSGLRIAVDRDEDGALDGDEVDLGSDPADPDSRPAPR